MATTLATHATSNMHDVALELLGWATGTWVCLVVMNYLGLCAQA